MSQEIDITNPEALRDALAGEGLFRPEDTPAQKAALTRLETALALVEGWVATVVSAAANIRLESGPVQPARIAASCARRTCPWISASPTIIDSRPAVTR